LNLNEDPVIYSSQENQAYTSTAGTGTEATNTIINESY